MECTPWWQYFVTLWLSILLIKIIDYFVIPFIKWYIRWYKKVKNNQSDSM